MMQSRRLSWVEKALVVVCGFVLVAAVYAAVAFLFGMLVLGLLACLHALFPAAQWIPRWDFLHCLIAGAGVLALRMLFWPGSGRSSKSDD